ncbi:MAG TPA: allantoicase [Thermoanaerobaculia bacterium]|nr:allantoicase [Thermoanaerobaculia bacterium]
MPHTFLDKIDLASERVGGSVLYATDDYFAEKENLLKPSRAVWKEHEYTDRGKWMDGWESRRKRVEGHDFAIIRLGMRGVVRGIVADTAFFRGNYPESCALEGTVAPAFASVEELLNAHWTEILPRSPLQGDSENFFDIESRFAFTHLRLHIFPDGGVARLRVHGDPIPDWHPIGGLGETIDLAAAENGAEVLTCSDMFFGPKHNLIMPGRALNMSDGWETKRRRGPGHDWVIVQLAAEGDVTRIEIDTNHFKGNYPDTCSIEASLDRENWTELLPRTKLQAHTRHFFRDELAHVGPTRFLRLNVFPDGGVSRLRVWGTASEHARREAVVKRLDTLVPAALARELMACCASTRWAARVADAAPFGSWDALLESADRIWSQLDPEDWQEAFAAHPRIGERKPVSRWSSEEQSGTNDAANETMHELAVANQQYEEKFGHVFLICATGRNADEILANCLVRMQNDADTELRNAAEEQRKITHLRLMKLVM